MENKKIKSLEKEIEQIKERNKKVESDKAWETSLTRKFAIVILTYFIIVITFYTLSLPKPLVNAIIPALAFFISTLTIPFLKKIWTKKVN